ncbi:MAG: 2'-5' RNA ligase family protein [Chloroflexota bacterium]
MAAQTKGDYRIFVGAFPTGELAAQIQAVRVQYDAKTARITAPHVTIVGTYWRSGAATAANEAGLIERLRPLSTQLSPFDLILGGIHTFGGRVVYLGVQGTPPLLALREALLDVTGMDKHRGHFTPHLTLAMRLKQRDTEQMVTTLRASVWENGRFTAPIHTLHLMQRGAQDTAWRTIAAIPLAAD